MGYRLHAHLCTPCVRTCMRTPTNNYNQLKRPIFPFTEVLTSYWGVLLCNTFGYRQINKQKLLKYKMDVSYFLAYSGHICVAYLEHIMDISQVRFWKYLEPILFILWAWQLSPTPPLGCSQYSSSEKSLYWSLMKSVSHLSLSTRVGEGGLIKG